MVTKFKRQQYAQAVYLSHYMGASLAHVIKLAVTLPFRPAYTDFLISDFQHLLDGEIGFMTEVTA